MVVNGCKLPGPVAKPKLTTNLVYRDIWSVRALYSGSSYCRFLLNIT